jgi:uncharacterized membrane protein (Fun14 family)
MIPQNLLMSLELQRFGLEVGSSAIIGGIVGFASKKVAKLLLILVGLELAFLQALEVYGLIDVKWNAINSGVASLQKMVQQDAPPPDVVTVLSSLSIGGGFVGGFLLGFKRA